MKNKSLLLLLLVAISFLSQPLLRQIDNDYYYFAAGAAKNIFLIFAGFMALLYLHYKKTTSILIVVFVLINFTLCPLNLVLLDSQTYELGVRFNENYPLVKSIRWAGTLNLSSLYSVIEYLMIIQGTWSVGVHYISRIMGRLRGLFSYSIGIFANYTGHSDQEKSIRSHH